MKIQLSDIRSSYFASFSLLQSVKADVDVSPTPTNRSLYKNQMGCYFVLDFDAGTT